MTDAGITAQAVDAGTVELVGTPAPNPTPCAELATVAAVDRAEAEGRIRLDCATRPACVERMAAIRAPGFTCSNCSAGTREAIETWRANVPGLARLGNLIGRLAVAPDAAVPEQLRTRYQRRSTRRMPRLATVPATSTNAPESAVGRAAIP